MAHVSLVLGSVCVPVLSGLRVMLVCSHNLTIAMKLRHRDCSQCLSGTKRLLAFFGLLDLQR